VKRSANKSTRGRGREEEVEVEVEVEALVGVLVLVLLLLAVGVVEGVVVGVRSPGAISSPSSVCSLAASAATTALTGGGD
jgi:hypothetical protein